MCEASYFDKYLIHGKDGSKKRVNLLMMISFEKA